MAVAQNLSPYIGTRQSSSSPGTTEYYNAKSGQGFSDPNSLASYVNTLSPNAGATGQNVFSLVEKGFDMPSQSQPTSQPAGVGGPIAPITPQATSVTPPAAPGAPQPVAQPSQQNLNQLVGTRASAQDPKVTEYFNKSTGQGFATPEDLSAFLNSQGGNTNANNVFTELQKGFQNAMASGKPAPQSPGDAKSAVNALTPPSAVPKQMSPMAPIEQQLSADVGYQQLLADRAEYNSVANQSKSLLDFYNQATKDAGIPGLNEQLLNYKKIIDGTEDDIRREVQAVSGFATESQILGLASARNKTLIKNYNSLLDAKNMAQETVNNMVNIAGQDRQFALQAIEQKMQINEQIMQYRDKFVQNAKEGYANVVNAVGWQGLYQSLSSDPSALALAERTLGLQPGQMQQMVTQQQAQSNLSGFANYNISSPFVVTPGGEVQNTQTGQAYSNPEEFFKAAGVSSFDEANKKGILKPLGLTREQEQQNFENSLKLEGLALDKAQLNISQYNAQTSRINAMAPDKSVIDVDGQKVVISTDRNGNIINQQLVNTPQSEANAIADIIRRNPGEWGKAAGEIESMLGTKIASGSAIDQILNAHYGQGQSINQLIPQKIDDKTLGKIQQSPEYKTINAILPAIQAIKSYSDAINKFGTFEVWNGQGKGELQGTYGNALAAWKTLAGLGALSGADFSLAENAIPETGLFKRNSTAVSKLNESLKNAMSQVETLTTRLNKSYPAAASLLEDQLDQIKVIAYPDKFKVGPDGNVYEITQ